MTTTTAADLAAPLARYAQRFHAAAGPTHHVASPLGAWLLLALCAPASDGQARRTLTDVLGCDVEEAAAVAAQLLARPHPLVAAAAALWQRAGLDTAGLARWRTGLPPAVTTGDLPDQAGLDAWAREHTLGLIETFPVEITPDTLVVLATALATRVSWQQPFDLAPASALGAASRWSTGLTQVLRTPQAPGQRHPAPGHQQFVAATAAAGDVAVHAARARDGLAVVSVLAAPDVPAADVLAAAYDLAPAIALARAVPRRSLFDLPLGEGPLGTVSEQRTATTAATGREERCQAVLPAWSARSHHDLYGQAQLGMPAAASALAVLLGLPAYQYDARQSALARYSREGFEAAAVTGLAVMTSFQVPRDGLVRVAELRFGHPYAVVAVASPETGGSAPADDPWHGAPVFSAWVAEPEDAR